MWRSRNLLIVLLTRLFLATTPSWAWSPPPSSTETNAATATASRRVFLEKITTTAAIAAGLVGGGVVQPAAAAAADPLQEGSNKIYQPEPHSLDGKVILITGGSSGLGLESAKRLAAAGATIILTTRNDNKGIKAVSEVQSYLQERSISTDNKINKVYYLTLDLDDLDSIRSFPKRYENLFSTNAYKKIDVLMNNAGVAAVPTREITKDGFERTFQSNHLGPFLLTSLLFPYLNRQSGGGCRIINVSSIAHKYWGPLDFSNLNSEREYTGDGWQAYGHTKLENILFTQELQRRAEEKGMDWLSVSSLHPGVVGTDIWKNTYFGLKDEQQSYNLLQRLTSGFFYGSVLSTEEGSNTQVWLASLPASSSTFGKGQYFDENRNLAKTDFTKDTDVAVKLWEKSEELLGIKFDL